jgi:hypothetical protein
LTDWAALDTLSVSRSRERVDEMKAISKSFAIGAAVVAFGVPGTVVATSTKGKTTQVLKVTGKTSWVKTSELKKAS